MASVWKHPASQYWTACFRDHTGRQRRVSTKTSDKKLARRIAQEYERAIRNKRTFSQLEKTLRAFHEELCSESVAKRSLRAFCEEWLQEKEPSVSASTKKFYRGVVTLLLDYFGERADQPISEITRADLVAMRNARAKEVSASTVNHDFIAVRMIFCAAKLAKRVAEDPAEAIGSVREFDDPNETGRRAFTIVELQTLLAVVDDPEWQSMIRVGLYSGARLGDIALLRWANVNFDRNELRYIARKTGKSACIPIGRVAEPSAILT
jgi:integrase